MKIGKVEMNLDWYSGRDEYSDGAIEDEMLRIARLGDRHKIREAVEQQMSWPFFYHFSPVRENILRWYPFGEEATVLEIGAGCGAVTGALCDTCKQVDAVDLSQRRSMINAYRHSECDNLTLYVGNFNDVAEKLDKQYDYVTLIGVFEYGNLYIPSEHPFDDFLERCNSLLQSGGKILIAIENRLGLKYFAGNHEDHNGRLFSGIEGYPEKDSARTFSRDEWICLLKRNGFEHFNFYYPYPDYKMPFSIFSDERLPEKGELHRNFQNCDRDRLVLFDEAKAFDALVEAKEFPLFSNSFFIEIERKEDR